MWTQHSLNCSIDYGCSFAQTFGTTFLGFLLCGFGLAAGTTRVRAPISLAKFCPFKAGLKKGFRGGWFSKDVGVGEAFSKAICLFFMLLYGLFMLIYVSSYVMHERTTFTHL